MKTVKAWAIRYVPEDGNSRFVVMYQSGIPELFPTRIAAATMINERNKQWYRIIRVEIRAVKPKRRKK